MNLNFLIKKKHIFKRRKNYKFKKLNKLYSYNGLFSTNSFRFEMVYLKVIKKLFRKKYIKKKVNYIKTKYWVMVKPNFLLTMKSKNSRMGSGVGSYVRVCSIIKPNTPIILFIYHSPYIINLYCKYFKLKLNVNLRLI